MKIGTLLQRVREHAHSQPHALAYAHPCGPALTYAGLAASAAALAQRLQAELPAQAVVMLSCPNQLAFPVALLAVLGAGLTVFPVSTDLSEIELCRAAKESSAAAVIGDDRAISVLGDAVKLGIRTPDIALTATAAWPAASTGDLLLQSSGTTALPKIVRRRGHSLDRGAAVMAEGVGILRSDRVLMTVPLSHSYGFEHGLLAPLWAGAAVMLCRGLDLSVLPEQLAIGGITVLPGVPSTFEILAHSTEPTLRMPTVHTAYSAGGPLPIAVFQQFQRRFGVRVAQLYGASEIGSVTFNHLTDDFDPASVGGPMRDVSLRILHIDDNSVAQPAGQEGIVAVRSSSMFDGYLSGEAPIVDGHFITGDLGRLDARGRLLLTGRIKSLIDVGGMKVNPLEVEAVLLQHPGVAACAVVPIRQSQTVHRLKAIVVPRDPAAGVSIDALRTLARLHLSAYKIPRLFEVRDSLPLSATGKVLRHLLEET
jgi:long-chain acyl-CoA synthetase